MSLPIVPFVVGRTRQRFYAVETGSQRVRSTSACIRKRRSASGNTAKSVNHPPLGLVDVFAATLPTLAFNPGVHVNYAETVLPMRDGLPKLKDFPKEFGGSGELVPE